jgi:hypothetical protein
VHVYLEVTPKKVFACAVDWPGWSRSGKTEEAAVEALDAYRPRYAVVAEAAGLRLPRSTVEVVERVAGSASTEFGVPGAITDSDRRPLKGKQAARAAALVGAAWDLLDRVAAGAPPTLRKGPRGGGRERDAIVTHVLEAESAYARKVGIRFTPPALTDRPAIEAARAQMLAAIENGVDGGWPARYFARRTAWHVIDHAWEIEDRIEP